MTIHQIMAEVFTEAQIPGFLQEWRSTAEYPQIPDKYCCYIVTMEDEALCADDMEIMHQTQLSVHIYGKSDISAEYGRLREALDTRGLYIPRVRDMDDVRAGEYQYHKSIDLTWFEDLRA